MINRKCRSKTFADIEYRSKSGLHWIIEAKSHDSSDKHNAIHKVFGELLKETGRGGRQVEKSRYGLLLPSDGLAFFGKGFLCVERGRFVAFGDLVVDFRAGLSHLARRFPSSFDPRHLEEIEGNQSAGSTSAGQFKSENAGSTPRGNQQERFKTCAYCGQTMHAHQGVKGCPKDKVTIEHLNRNGPFRWSKGVREVELVLCCGACNSSRGTKILSDWFNSNYCRRIGIGVTSVAEEVRRYLETKEALN